MIIASCPLRISLVGGSTDNPKFVERYNYGSVISFPSNLRTYVTIHQDVFGSNSIDHKYNILYSKRETTNSVHEIQNELIRNCFEYLNVEQINCALTSDIHSVGSGLAASSAYLQAMIKAIHAMRRIDVAEFQVCKIAEKIEKRFNPLVGQQDFYGSMGKLKRIEFFKDKDPKITYLETNVFDNMDINLLYTGIVRNSQDVLETVDISKSLTMLEDVFQLEGAIKRSNEYIFNLVIKNGWEKKKKSSPLICSDPTLRDLDDKLSKCKDVLSHKLCGAGAGGYFLIFSKKGADLSELGYVKPIQVSQSGLKYINLKDEFEK